MSWDKITITTLYCDGEEDQPRAHLGGVPLTNCIESLEGADTVAELRALARNRGWRHHAGRDVCPAHTDQLSDR